MLLLIFKALISFAISTSSMKFNIKYYKIIYNAYNDTRMVQAFCLLNNLCIVWPGCENENLPDEKRFQVDQFHCGTDVVFDDVSPETIWSYIETGEPMLLHLLYIIIANLAHWLVVRGSDCSCAE